MKTRIMSHMVSHYPNFKGSLEFAMALVDGGASYLEVQFPFSDPTADGPYIQEACKIALEEGFSINSGFKLIERIKRFAEIPIFLMCYANIPFTYGIKDFIRICKETGVEGLIVPDLPYDYDEGLYTTAREYDLHPIPVVAFSMKEKRLRNILSQHFEFVYAILRKGITGIYTDIGEENIRFIKEVSSYGGKVLAGFGISSREQVELLMPHVHAVVVGSAFIKNVQAATRDKIYNTIFKFIKSLQGE